MGRAFLRFTPLFIIIIVGSYLVHNFVINAFSLQRNTSLINISYILNGGFALLLIWGVIVFYKRFKDQIGFIFMGGSLVKMALFMAILKLNGYQITKNAFLDFFIPYVICLIIEVYYISRILNNSK